MEAYITKSVLEKLHILLREMIKDGKKCVKCFTPFDDCYLVIHNGVEGGLVPIPIPDDLKDKIKEDVTLTYETFIPKELLENTL